MIFSVKRSIFIVLLALAAAAFGGCSGKSDLTSAEKALMEGPDSLMRVLTIYDKNDSLMLRSKSMDFTDRDLRSKAFESLSARMLYTVKDPSQDGVGIAAPQVGLNRRVVAVQRFDLPGEPFKVYPNIRVESLSGEISSGLEGCLSVPGWSGSVPRYSKVTISYKDPSSLEVVRETVEGFTAVIFQHETDHLEGILYIDKADSLWVDK